MRICWYAIFVFVIFYDSWGQTPPYYYEFNSVQVEEVIQRLESDFRIRIFYLPKWVDDVKVSGTFSGDNKLNVLKQIFDPLGINMVSYDSQTYVLVKELRNGEVLMNATSNGVRRPLVVGDLDSTLTGATIRGYVRDAKDNSPVVGATIHVRDLAVGTVSDDRGFFRLELPVGSHRIEFSSIGYTKDVLNIILQSDGEIVFRMLDGGNELQEVVIEGDRDIVTDAKARPGHEIVKIEDVEFVPSFMGEKDIIKYMELLPGVNSTGEGANGFSIRGGNAGQNLIFMDGAPLYNSSHLFGLFSVFNAGLVKSMSVYKGVMPAAYGGRVSSIIDVRLKDSGSEDVQGEVAVGLMSSRAHVITSLTEKLSIGFGGKFSYVNRYLEKMKNWDVRGSKAGFYDVDLKINYDVSEKSTFSANGFVSRDDFKLPTGDEIAYGNEVASGNFIHKYSGEVMSNFTLSYGRYWSSSSSEDSLLRQRIKNDIATYRFYTETSFFHFDSHILNVGLEAGLTNVDPGEVVRINFEGESVQQIEKEQALELGAYFEDEHSLNDHISIDWGLRYSYFFLLGPNTEYVYKKGESRRASSVLDSIKHESGDIVATYGGLEPRVSIRYSLDNGTSLKMSIGCTRQYLHLISNSASVSPLSIYKLSDQFLKPQIANIGELGVFHKFKNIPVTVSGEVFYRKVHNLTDYRNGADLFTNANIERDLLAGEGRSYGVELELKKTTGKLSGFFSYTFLRSFNKIDGSTEETRINDGMEYPSDNDRPHSISFSGDYMISRLWSVSFNWVFNSGRPTTIPEAIYRQNQMEIAYFSSRNEYRLPDYHRLDLTINLKGTNLKKEKKWDTTWAFSLYNVYGRNNTYSIFFEQENRKIVANKLSILPSPVPSISLIAKF